MLTYQRTPGCALAPAPVRCPPPTDPFEELPFGPSVATAPPDSAVISPAGQIASQRRAVAVLGKLLERAAVEDLPPVTWTVASAGAVLVGRFDAVQMEQRCDDFNAWRIAVGTWANRGADVRRDHADRAGTVRLVDQWDRFEGVTVTLAADIYADD
jgi:hypothetical protein